jgi:hypothetical protein
MSRFLYAGLVVVGASFTMLTSCHKRCDFHDDPEGCAQDYENQSGAGASAGYGGGGRGGTGECSTNEECGAQDDPCRSHKCEGGQCVYADLENPPVELTNVDYDCLGAPYCLNGDLIYDPDPADHMVGGPAPCMKYACLKDGQELKHDVKPVTKYKEDGTCADPNVCDGKGSCGLKEGKECGGDGACASAVCDTQEMKCKKGMFEACKMDADCGSYVFTCKINDYISGPAGICLKNPGHDCKADDDCSTNFCDNGKCAGCEKDNPDKSCNGGFSCTKTGYCKVPCTNDLCPAGFDCDKSEGNCNPKCNDESSGEEANPCAPPNICVSGYCVPE